MADTGLTRLEESDRRRPKAGPRCATYARYSSDLQYDKSIDDQQRICRKHADENGLEILPEFEFVDAAISGTTPTRKGLDSLRDAAAQRRFSVLVVHSLSRLSRETTFVLPLLKELNAVHGIRILSVSEGVDSDREGWYEMAMLFSLVHEKYLKDLSANVHRGQVGTVLAGFSAGDYVLGYTSVVAEEGPSRGRNAKPRRKYAVDEGGAFWVKMIFAWYAREERSVSWIVNELNRNNVQKDHRSTTKTWYHQLVTGILRNEKYVGRWDWGRRKNARNPFTGQVKQLPRDESEVSEWRRDFAELRLIDQETFDLAQARLRAAAAAMRSHRDRGGRLRGSTGRRSPDRLLSGVVICEACGRRLVVADNRGQRLHCGGHVRQACSMGTHLRRDLAEELVINELAARLVNNGQFVEAVFKSCVQAWAENTESRPAVLEQKGRERHKRDTGIQRLLRLAEESDVPDPDILDRLKELRAERDQLVGEIELLESAPPKTKSQPTLEWVRNQLETRFHEMATATPASIRAIQELFGSKLVVREIEAPHRKRKFLQGEFRLSPSHVSSLLLGTSYSPTEDELVITLDFRRTTITEDQARQAHALWESGKSCEEIAGELKVTASRVTAIFKFADETLGLPYPDTRSRRPPGALYTSIEAEVMAMWDGGKLIHQIASELDVCRPTVHTVVKRWHERNGLPMPDGRSRRKSLPVKQLASPETPETERPPRLPAAPPISPSEGARHPGSTLRGTA